MRLIKGLTALAVLVTLVAGIPTALVLLGGNPLPDHLSWAGVARTLLRRDDGTVLFALVTVIGWLAWSVFALSLLAELVQLVSGARIRIALPGLAGPRRLAAGLLLAVVTMVAMPAASYAGPSVTPADAGAAPDAVRPAVTSQPQQGSSARVPAKPATSVSPARMPAPATSAVPEQIEAPTVTHQVQRGDDLWSLAEHYYGQGRDWRKIAAANPDVLTGGPDRLQPGWRLTIPDLDLPPRTSAKDSDSVRVAEGDTLSEIAERRYGRADRWRDIYDANRSRIRDPDQIQVGAELLLPAAAEPSATKESGPKGSSDGPSSQQAYPPAESDEAGGAASRPAPTRQTAPSAERAAEPEPPPSRPATAERSARVQPPAAGAGSAAEARVDLALEVGAVGGLLAASLLSGLALRRRAQLQARPVGRRITHAPAPVQAVETALGHRQSPLGPEALDLALRATAAHCHNVSAPLPQLATVTLGPERLLLAFAGAAPDPPVGFQAVPRGWLLELVDAGYLASVPGVERAARPYPALATLGRDRNGEQVLLDLESCGVLALDGVDPQETEPVMAAIAVELSFAPWADELVLTLVGSDLRLPDALGKHNVTRTDDMDGLLLRLERRAEIHRTQARHEVLGQHRVDPELADAWVPEVVLAHRRLTTEQNRRLIALTTTTPRVPLAAVTSGPLDGAGAVLRLEASRGGDPASSVAVLEPLGLTVAPQLLPASSAAAVVELVTATGSDATTPAPWWMAEPDAPGDRPPDNVTFLGRRFGGWGDESAEDGGPVEIAEEAGVVQRSAVEEQRLHHPLLRILGPVELVGATGVMPPRASKQCLEYCGWLLEHPGTSAQAMAAALVVAEGTRRSNMSRLRTWLGADQHGEPYLPDAYTGRIVLHPSVSSDWQRLQILTAGGVNVTSRSGLIAALELVRGAPLADAAPGQWHWAEELRTDMISVVRDIGVELTARALADSELDLARWAASRALVAAPGDELLMAARIRTEHRAGNAAETERLTLQLAAQARSLGVDLNPETVSLLQEVLEGRVRARLA